MGGKKVFKKDILRKIIFIIALGVFIFSSFKLVTIWNEYNKNSESYEEVQKYAPEEVVEEESGESRFTFSSENYEELLKINSEFKGWINVPNTKINYPVVQAKENEYYLNHNFKRESNSGGAIFLSFDNLVPFEERNTTIHGHNMKDGSMFASLIEFGQEEFFNNNRKIYIALANEILEYEIFSVYEEKANVYPYNNIFNSDNEYIDYLNKLKNKSMYNSNSGEFNKNDKIITLSTCAYDIEDGRLLVHGKLVKRESYNK